MQLVDASRATRLDDDEAGLFQQPQVPRHGGATDGQVVRDLTDGTATRAKQLNNGAPIGITKGVERVALEGRHWHWT